MLVSEVLDCHSLSLKEVKDDTNGFKPFNSFNSLLIDYGGRSIVVQRKTITSIVRCKGPRVLFLSTHHSLD